MATNFQFQNQFSSKLSKDILSMKNEIGVLMNHYTTFNFMIYFHLNYLEFASPGKWNWSPYTSNYNFQLVIQSTINEIESYKNAIKSHLPQVQVHNNTYKHNNSILQQDRYRKPLLSFQQFPLHHNTIFKLAFNKQSHHESLE